MLSTSRRRLERWKTTLTIGLVISKQLCGAAHLFCTFLCRCFARLRRETFVQKFPAYNWFHVLWGKCRTCPCSLFFSLAHMALIFTLHLIAARISYFLTAATKFSCCSFNKTSVSHVFYLSLAPPPPPPSLSLSLLSSFIAFFPSHHMKFFPAFFLGIDDFLYHF